MSSQDYAVINSLTQFRQGFDYNFHNRVRTELPGLYAFWLDSGACLYVGQSWDIRERLYRHRMHETNRALERYFRAFPRRIRVSYIGLQGKRQADLDRLERRAIALLRPLTNILHQI